MLFNGRNSFNQVGNPPYFFYGNPIDVLSNFRVSYHCTKDEKLVTTYDTTKLKYDKLKSLSSKESQGYNDFLLSRFGAQGASFFALEQRKIESKMIFSNLTNKEKVKRIDNNISDIESIINELSNNVSESGKPVTKLISDDIVTISSLIKAAVSTEEVLRQINLESEKYVEFTSEKPPKQDDEETNYPHRPPVDTFPDEKEEEPPKEEEDKPIKPELPSDALFIDIKSEEKIELGLNDKIILRYVTNAYNTGVSYSHQKLVNVDFNTFMLENGGYEFLITSTKKIGSSYITIKAWNDDNSILEKRINVTVREEPMSDNKYPIITDADENGIKWLIKSEGSEPKPLYPPFYIEWEKLLYQEKQRIPASILILKHKQEMTVNGVVVDENGRKQYAPTYKYIEQMSRDEIEAISFDVLGQDERLAFYGDAYGNIAFRDEVYYKPLFKAWSTLTDEQKYAIDFDSLYIEHKKELYANKNNVIIGPNGVNYYPPKYKAWTDMTPDEKYAIDTKILEKKDKEEIYDEAGNKVLKTSLRVSTNRLVLSEEKGQMIGVFKVYTNASTFDFTVTNPEVLTAVKSGNQLIVSPNGPNNKDIEVSILITAQAQGQQLSKETITVYIDFIDDTKPPQVDPDEPEKEDVQIIVSPNVVSIKEGETGRFSYYVTNEKEPKLEVKDITVCDFIKSQNFITVIGKNEGKTTISLAVYNEEGTEVIAQIEVPVLVEKASEDPQNVLEIDTTPLTLDIGEERKLGVKSNDDDYEVESTDPEVMKVDKDGFIVTVTALKNGRANIKFTANKTKNVPVSIMIIGYVKPAVENEDANPKQ